MEEARTSRVYKVVIEPDEDGVFIATVPTIPGIVEQGTTSDDAFENLKAALEFTLDDMYESGEEIPPSDPHPGQEVRNIEFAV